MRYTDDVEIFTGKRVNCKHCNYPKRFYYEDKDRLICDNCKRWVYIDESTELKYKNKEQINKLKKALNI